MRLLFRALPFAVVGAVIGPGTWPAWSRMNVADRTNLALHVLVAMSCASIGVAILQKRFRAVLFLAGTIGLVVGYSGAVTSGRWTAVVGFAAIEVGLAALAVSERASRARQRSVVRGAEVRTQWLLAAAACSLFGLARHLLAWNRSTLVTNAWIAVVCAVAACLLAVANARALRLAVRVPDGTVTDFGVGEAPPEDATYREARSSTRGDPGEAARLLGRHQFLSIAVAVATLVVAVRAWTDPAVRHRGPAFPNHETSLETSNEWIHAVALSADGRFLALSQGRAVTLYDLDEREIAWTKELRHEGCGDRLGFASTGNSLFAFGREVCALSLDRGVESEVAVPPRVTGGNWLLAARADRFVRVDFNDIVTYDVGSGISRQFPADCHELATPNVSADGSELAGWCPDRLRRISLTTGEVLASEAAREERWPSDFFPNWWHQLVRSSDGKRLLGFSHAGWSPLWVVWDTKTLERISTSLHSDSIDVKGSAQIGPDQVVIFDPRQPACAIFHPARHGAEERAVACAVAQDAGVQAVVSSVQPSGTRVDLLPGRAL